MSKQFRLLEFWFNLHASVTGVVLPSPSKLPVQSRVAFLAAIKNVKDTFGVAPEDIMRALLYAYTHNPLAFDSLQMYGKYTTLYRVLPSYKQWESSHRAEIKEDGMAAVLERTRPHHSGVIMGYVDDLENIYKSA